MSARPFESVPAASRRLPAPALTAGELVLPVPLDARRALARGWLSLGVLALVAAGLFSLLLVLARAPYTQALIPWPGLFRTALVVHVDLSVLVWFVAFGGVLWSLNSAPRWIRLGQAALGLALAGTALMVVAPFAGNAEALMSNYIPVLRQPVFLAGLLVFGLAALLLVVRAMSAIPPVGRHVNGAAALRFGLNTAAITTLLALAAFAASYVGLPRGLGGRAYYELLFWGGGHVLQFTYTQLMLVAWLWLASASGLRLPCTPRVALALFALGLAAVFTVPLIYLAHPVGSAEHIRFFTWLMQYGGSLATLPLALIATAAILTGGRARPAERPLRAALIASVVLFGIGGGLGFLIGGSNVTIPAHYHGCIVGVTLAFMGLTYYLLPRLGFAEPNRRWAARQPWLYGGGQLLHVIGLAVSGGYGVQRKVAGAEQGLESLERIAAMGLMGLGGLAAVAGGAVFLLVVLGSVARGVRRARAR